MFAQIIEFSMNHPLLVGTFVLLLIAVIVRETRSGTTGLTSAQAVHKLNRESAVVLDIRDRKDYAAGHITGAINIPLINLESRAHELDKYKNQLIIVVCKTGTTAGSAIVKLNKAGFEQVALLKGGMMQWQTDSLPVVKK